MKLTVAALAAAPLLGALATGPFQPPARPVPADSAARARALHALNRLTWGPRPGDVDRVAQIGVEQFIRQQLTPERIADESLARRLTKFEVLETSPAEMARVFADAMREQRARQRARGGDSMARPPAERPDPANPEMRAQMMRDAQQNPLRRLLGQYQAATVTRAALSERQLYEVMVDFWTNHFNVFIGKGADRFLLPGYIENTIRPRALGRFEDLLRATAESPAMLFYLDNVQSVAPGSRPPQLGRLNRAQGRRRPFGMGPSPERLDSLRQMIEQRMPKGINENYARELLELHTLGVDGGYTQLDVQEVARILTGWSINLPRRDPEFVFHDWAHDFGAKTVLGERFPAGRGREEGEELLRMLARHPATMRHISGKLCARFVSDVYSDGCVDAGVRAWERSGGEIREVVRAIVSSPEFWAPANRAAKLKTPYEFVVSAVRALGAEPDTTAALALVVARLGQPLFGQQAPTGYPETQESWVNSGALLQRMNVALGLAAGKIPGTQADLDRLIEARSLEPLISEVNNELLNGTASANTLATMRKQAADLDPSTARTLVVGLALGSPEFQRQ